MKNHSIIIIIIILAIIIKPPAAGRPPPPWPCCAPGRSWSTARRCRSSDDRIIREVRTSGKAACWLQQDLACRGCWFAVPKASDCGCFSARPGVRGARRAAAGQEPNERGRKIRGRKEKSANTGESPFGFHF